MLEVRVLTMILLRILGCKTVGSVRFQRNVVLAKPSISPHATRTSAHDLNILFKHVLVSGYSVCMHWPLKYKDIRVEVDLSDILRHFAN